MTSGPCLAQTGIDLYGIVDVGVRATSDLSANIGGWQFKAIAARNKADTGADKTVRQRVLSAGVCREAWPGLLVTTA
jgi:hypothetical protein